ncbi:MAG: ATP phosphoribosyltransferase regulatory subunit [Ancalomicrobiaceae bacterium]|nr:ATP phosphoribosyltransferase regulatory subunit [Ancalomicrobiaceae bacterium]
MAARKSDKTPEKPKRPTRPRVERKTLPDELNPEAIVDKFFGQKAAPAVEFEDIEDIDAYIDDIDPISDLTDLFEDSGAELVDVPVLQQASLFIDTAGEDIRRRLFITTDAEGNEYCLRPDFTIPVCRLYIDAGLVGEQAALAYHGPVFRQQAGETGEFEQAGFERFGDEDRPLTDAEMLRLAFDALEVFGLVDPEVRIGDEGLFSALLEALNLPQAWRRRLRASFGDRTKLNETIDRLVAGSSSELLAHAGFLGALANADAAAAREVVEDLLAIAGIKAVGGRTAHEIAERFLEQAALSAEGGLSPEKAEILKRFLDIAGDPDAAADALDVFRLETGLDLDLALSTFRARLRAMRACGIEPSNLQFAADFGRQFDYYTGFVFEMRDPDDENKQVVIGGGRYDGLLQRLGAAEMVPAIGFSMWLDRLSLELDVDIDLSDFS